MAEEHHYKLSTANSLRNPTNGGKTNPITALSLLTNNTQVSNSVATLPGGESHFLGTKTGKVYLCPRSRSNNGGIAETSNKMFYTITYLHSAVDGLAKS